MCAVTIPLGWRGVGVGVGEGGLDWTEQTQESKPSTSLLLLPDYRCTVTDSPASLPCNGPNTQTVR